VYCKDDNRDGSYPVQQFDILGFNFRARKIKNRIQAFCGERKTQVPCDSHEARQCTDIHRGIVSLLLRTEKARARSSAAIAGKVTCALGLPGGSNTQELIYCRRPPHGGCKVLPTMIH
jgi:hypothetical protein